MGAFAEVNEVYGSFFEIRPAGPRGDRRRGAAARREGRDRRRGGAPRLAWPWQHADRSPSTTFDAPPRTSGDRPRDARAQLPHAGERAGGEVFLKAENLQRTGSFKLRGALAKIAALGSDCTTGVVAGSAGNHAQAVAYAARERGVPCEVFMPESAPIAKVEAAPPSAPS